MYNKTTLENHFLIFVYQIQKSLNAKLHVVELQKVTMYKRGSVRNVEIRLEIILVSHCCQYMHSTCHFPQQFPPLLTQWSMVAGHTHNE